MLHTISWVERECHHCYVYLETLNQFSLQECHRPENKIMNPQSFKIVTEFCLAYMIRFNFKDVGWFILQHDNGDITWFLVAENCNTNNIHETLSQSLEQIYI